jgi:hypothetical protein
LFASAAQLQTPVFFTDCSNLAKGVPASGANDPALLWEIRRQVIQFQNLPKPLHSSIYYISILAGRSMVFPILWHIRQKDLAYLSLPVLAGT